MNSPVSGSASDRSKEEGLLAAVGGRLRAARLERNLTQNALSELAGVHVVHLSRLERGHLNVGVATLQKVSSALGVPLAALLEVPEPDSDLARPIGLEDLSDLDIAWPHHSDTLRPSKGDSKAIPIEGGHGGEYLYMSGYRLAATKLAAQIQDGPRENEALLYPFVLCWRHHIELQLKAFLSITAPMLGEALPQNLNRTHSLGSLWGPAKRHILQIFPDDPSADTVVPERLIGQLADLDADGATFRYAHTVSGSPTITKPTSLAIGKFNSSLENLSGYFNGAIEGAAYLSDAMPGSESW